MAEDFTAETLASMMSGMRKDSYASPSELRQIDREAALSNRIMGRVHEGKITPEYGDRFAMFFGFPSLSNPPDPSNIEVERIGFWNLEMVVAWIIWRDDETVLRHYPPFCSGRRIWIRNAPSVDKSFPPVRAKLPVAPLGFSLHPLNSTNLIDPFRTVAGAIECLAKHKWAIAELGGALMRSEITANAMRLPEQHVMKIPAEEWQHVKPAIGQDGRTELQCGLSWYANVSFPSAEVLRVWPNVDVMERRLPYKKDVRPLTGKSRKIECAIKERWPNGIELKFYLNPELREEEVTTTLNEIFGEQKFHSKEAFSKMVWRALSHLFSYPVPPQ